MSNSLDMETYKFNLIQQMWIFIEYFENKLIFELKFLKLSTAVP